MLISKVHSYMPAYRLQGKLIFDCVIIYRTFGCPQYVLFFNKGGGSIEYKGQILNIEQDISSIAKHLPLMHDEIPCFLAQKSNQSSVNGYRDFKINKDNILLWLQFFLITFAYILIFIIKLLRSNSIKFQLMKMVPFKVGSE